MSSPTARPVRKSRAPRSAAQTHEEPTIAGEETSKEHGIASLLKPAEFQYWATEHMKACTQMTSRSAEGVMTLWSEMGAFTGHRLQAGMETASALAGCRTGGDIFRCSADYWDGMIRSYADETAKLAHLVADMTKSATTPMEACSASALQSIASIPEHNGMFV